MIVRCSYVLTASLSADNTDIQQFAKTAPNFTLENVKLGAVFYAASESPCRQGRAVPTMQFRSANTLPRELDLFRASDGRLYVGVKTSPGTESLCEAKKSYSSVMLNADAVSYELPADGLCEINLDLNLITNPRQQISFCRTTRVKAS